MQIKINLEFRNTQLHNSAAQLREDLEDKNNKLQAAEVALAQANAAAAAAAAANANASAATPTAERSAVSASTSPAPTPTPSSLAESGTPAFGAPTAAEHDLLMRKYKKVKRILQEYRRRDGAPNRNSSLGAGDAPERPDSYNTAAGDTLREETLLATVSTARRAH